MSFTTFSDMDPSISLPPAETGCAAPIFVPGAMAARCPATVIITPAEAAPAPLGDTYTITGTGELRISLTIVRMEDPSPPGVSRRITAMAAPVVFASASPLVTYEAVAGLIAPSTSMIRAPPLVAANEGVEEIGLTLRITKVSNEQKTVSNLTIFDLQA
ncbi:hypothetical protein PITCH_A760015 [uncultured Desulfobacterium sp.]|uniref:Uncharacterized protein n=1 Tax=uncultured Desulfobacterium sp. TaxID=201089 RepID=A0A445N279_9BACT|nr:hypothetical protein PITCH_A760015 [uncultured Desulfobacterium sp.]